jgi:CRISPR system Cascade subunit CasC
MDMNRFVQLHYLTFYPPSNPNRDDTNRPKTAVIGGSERLRISSQALKRAIRKSTVFRSRLDGHIGARTRQLGQELREYLVRKGMADSQALETARTIASAFGKIADEKADDPAFIAQLAFVSPQEREAAFTLADQALSGETLESGKMLAEKILRRHDSAADIGMFGRMLADSPDFNREAAVQVAHAITTHAVAVEDDFYTAVDDLKRPSDDTGAGFMGSLGFGSGIFYIYACVDRALLVENLCGDEALAKTSLAALIEALAVSSPNGKKASFAHGGRASYLLAERGEQQPRTLASAFVRPVVGDDLLRRSIDRLEDTCKKMDAAYGRCADARSEMDVEAGRGTLAGIVAFATE